MMNGNDGSRKENLLKLKRQKRKKYRPKRNRLSRLIRSLLINTAQNKEVQKELQKAQRNFQQLEEKIAILTKEKLSLESNLALPEIYLEKQKFVDAENRYQQKSNQLKKANEEYEKLFEKIMEMEEKAQ